jgi:hypothetical protein
MRSKFLPVIFLVGAAHTLFAAEEKSWMEPPLVNWNRTADRVPQPPPFSDDTNLSRCQDTIRPPETLPDQALVGAGWTLFGPLQIFGGTTLITAMRAADGMCRPLQYQAFVFVEGKLAGTLSPVLMNSRTDGSITAFRLLRNDSLEATVARYSTSDPLCCPSATATVQYRIEATTSGPLVIPVDATTVSLKPPEPPRPPEPQQTVMSEPQLVETPAQKETPVPAPAPALSPEPTVAQVPDIPAVAQSTDSSKEKPSGFIGVIQDASVVKGCGCRLKSASDSGESAPYVFIAEIIGQKRAWINLNGADVMLSFQRTNQPKGKASEGQQFREVYVHEDIEVTLDSVVKNLPGPKERFAEYETTITVKSGGKTETLHAVGKCGC